MTGRASRVAVIGVTVIAAALALSGVGGAVAAAPLRPGTPTVTSRSAAKPPSRPTVEPSSSRASSALLAGTTCRAFGADTYWHAPVDGLPVNARSAQWLAHMSPARTLHPDFGPSYGDQPVPYGIPITIAPPGHAKVAVTFDYADESDAGPYPLGLDTLIEGGAGATGDRHAIVVDAGTCTLYETYATGRTVSGGVTHWTAGSGAVWSLASPALRPAQWTSADAAGLPILPGLLRLDEVLAGSVDHAIRFTTDITDRAYVWPARHQAGSVSDHTYPPMGARFRLKASFSLSGRRADTQVVLRAMQTYGLVLADNGSPWYFQGQSVDGWPEGLISELKAIPAVGVRGSGHRASDGQRVQRGGEPRLPRGADHPAHADHRHSPYGNRPTDARREQPTDARGRHRPKKPGQRPPLADAALTISP